MPAAPWQPAQIVAASQRLSLALNTVSSPPAASVQANPILSLHNSIFNDMKALIQPIADSIETINNRLDVIKNRNSARSLATITAPISGPASASVPRFLQLVPSASPTPLQTSQLQHLLFD
ncbi:hypothetical protein EOD39_11385 [Acipenser ruthenus]|uniref:Uncharacterized protein n=1 Tax=Acipenser ruthenus TaxID=7906 RepID=A0A662YTN2_ACIRT|nr:hypothetical protein EOD39_11385 [Acipenser ruthenus]